MIKEILNATEKESIARLILNDLRKWFGIDEVREYQRRGIGSALYRTFEKISRSSGDQYIQVKTVQTG